MKNLMLMVLFLAMGSWSAGALGAYQCALVEDELYGLYDQDGDMKIYTEMGMQEYGETPRKTGDKIKALKISDGKNFYLLGSESFSGRSPASLGFSYAGGKKVQFMNGKLSKSCKEVFKQHEQYVKQSVPKN